MEFYEVVSSCEDVYQGSISPKWVNRSHAKKKQKLPMISVIKYYCLYPSALGKVYFENCSFLAQK